MDGVSLTLDGSNLSTSSQFGVLRWQDSKFTSMQWAASENGEQLTWRWFLSVLVSNGGEYGALSYSYSRVRASGRAGRGLLTWPVQFLG